MGNMFGFRGPPRTPGKSESRDFQMAARSQAEEDSYDYVKYRNVKFTGLVGSVAHMVKGALGGGILSGHVGYMKGGILVSIPLNIFFGVYMGFCLYLLVHAAQILYRRTRRHSMSYSDVGEAAFMLCKSPKLVRLAQAFRYTIDAIICLDLFGSCCCYQIIMAKSVKQLVENSHEIAIEPKVPGYPNLRVYLAVLIPLVVIICLIRHLKYLAPFSILANVFILFCIILSVYYAFHFNPTFTGLQSFRSVTGIFEFIGMSVFSMSCSGVVIAIENNMRDPHKFPLALACGMGLIICCTFSVSFFGYAAFLDKSDSPITINFPMDIFPKILKGLIAFMIYVTHALNFWVPFNLCFYYLKKRHAEHKRNTWELIYRTVFVIIIGCMAIIFPDINAIMGFLGCFCLSNMAFIWPNLIYLLVIWERPGFGYMKWRLWRSIIFIAIGIFIFICGSAVSIMELYTVFMELTVGKKDTTSATTPGAGGSNP